MADNMKAIIYGDSVMKGTVLDSSFHYRAVMDDTLKLFRNLFHVEAENRSRFGITVNKGYDILKSDLSSGRKAEYTLIEFGGNDCNYKWNEVSLDPEREHIPYTVLNSFMDTYKAMIRAIKANGSKPILMTLPPIDAERYLDFLTRAETGNDKNRLLKFLGDVQMIYRFHESYSHAVEIIANENNCDLVDVRSYFLDKHNYRSLMCIDGVHPNENGYSLVLQAFTDFAKSKGV